MKAPQKMQATQKNLIKEIFSLTMIANANTDHDVHFQVIPNIVPGIDAICVRVSNAEPTVYLGGGVVTSTITDLRKTADQLTAIIDGTSELIECDSDYSAMAESMQESK